MPAPRKKSLGERLGLFERVGAEPDYEPAQDADYEEYAEPSVEVVTGIADAVDFIGETYHNNGIDDLSRSIFKVEETLNTLPNTLPTAVRRTTVIGILTSFGISIQEVLEDADKRSQILGEVCRQTADAEQEESDRLAQEIEELRNQITEKQKQVQDHQQRKQEVEDISSAELKRINDLVEFLNNEK